MDETAGCLWAEDIADEILLFWQGQRLLALLRPIGLAIAGGSAGILRPSLAGVLPGLPIVAALYFCVPSVSRIVPPSMAASAQSIYAAVSSGLGGGLVMMTAGALYAGYGGRAYFFMAGLSALGVVGTIQLRGALPAEREPTDNDRCCKEHRREE